MMTPTVTTIVHSYNRPRMLREALASVVAARPDEIIVADDGSTFDVAATCREFGARLVALPPLTIDERMVACRQGPLINRALELAHGELIAYLCDDDLHDRRWYDCIRENAAAEPHHGLVRGTWLVFRDGDAPSIDDPPCKLDARKMTAGNFAHQLRLHRECGVRWPSDYANCLDHGFLVSCHNAGFDMFRAPLVGHAGWRREHAKALIHHSDGQFHKPSLRPILESEWME